MLSSLKIAVATATLACGSLVAAAPAHAATVPECTSYVKITQPNSTFYALWKSVWVRLTPNVPLGGRPSSATGPPPPMLTAAVASLEPMAFPDVRV